MRRSPPSSLILLPPSVPTPPRGTPKYYLPLPPQPLALSSRHQRAASASSATITTAQHSPSNSTGNTQPPWLTSRSKINEDEVLKHLRPPEVVVVFAK
ncbi:hypothetical protein P7C73_g812, partial [Tremellales sp. Uapishka_1]